MPNFIPLLWCLTLFLSSKTFSRRNNLIKLIYFFIRRDPVAMVKPPKNGSNEDNDYQNALKKATPTVSRHLILIRHGQYHLDGEKDAGRFLTDLGMESSCMREIKTWVILSKLFVNIVRCVWESYVQYILLGISDTSKDLANVIGFKLLRPKIHISNFPLQGKNRQHIRVADWRS